MKLLTITIPCYNSQDYMEKSICSALTGGDRVEIIIVDDGSSDNTLQIAKKYEEKFPNIVRVIHQENGGHGEAVNTGIKNATGLYFKVLDSDDCLGKKALEKVLDLLEDMVSKDAGLDMLVSNFMYDKQGTKHKKIMKYKSAMPVNRMFGWDELKFGMTQYLLMHSVIYRTKILRECGMVLPKHTFYVDNIFVYKPLYYVKTLYYLDIDFYRYYVGRPGQSISTKNMTDRYQMQLTVMKEIVKSYTYEDLKKLNKHHLKIMIHDLVIKHFLTCFFIYGNYSKEKNNEFHQYFRYFKNVSLSLYRKIMYRSCFTFGRYIFLPIKIFATKLIYKKIVRKRNWY